MNGTTPTEIIIGTSVKNNSATTSGPFTGSNLVAADLTSGQITCVSRADRSLVLAAAPPDAIQFVEYDLVRGLYYSQPIQKGQVTSYNVQNYTAPTAQVQTIDLVTAPAVGDVYTLVIKPRMERTYQMEPLLISFRAVTTSASDVHTGLAAALTGHPRFTEWFASAVGGATLVITGKLTPDVSQTGIYEPSFSNFHVGLLEGFSGSATNVITTNPTPGHGTFAQVRSLEHEYKGYRGHLNNVQFAEAYNYRSVVGDTYRVFTINYYANSYNQGENNTKRLQKIMQIFVKESAAANFTTYFNTLMALMVD